MKYFWNFVYVVASLLCLSLGAAYVYILWDAVLSGKFNN